MQRKPPQKEKRWNSALPSLHVKRSAELWLDVFSEVLPIYLGEDGETPLETALDKAHLCADGAVDRFERRWPGVKL
jgi:hypothetical protein